MEDEDILKCKICGNYKYIEYEKVLFDNAEEEKGFTIEIPLWICKTCNQRESILPKEPYFNFRDKILPKIKKGNLHTLPLKSIFPYLDTDKKFSQFEHLGFQYDPRDYYLIPGLYREWKSDKGYLTPVFFDKDLLLYYNGHPDYSVKFSSFSSCNIYYKGEKMFRWGFGVNRSGRLFKWLGDLNDDFTDTSMGSHLKRFQASNIASDHDVVSKFYLSQNPYSINDVFQQSDNEMKLFELKNHFSQEIKKKFGVELTKIDVEKLLDYYKSPIMNEREQIFSAYLSLDKYFIENLQEQSLRELLLKHGLSENTLQQKDGTKLKGLKLFTLFIQHILNKQQADEMITPLFVLHDLRQLHGHLNDTSFENKYISCKNRLGLQINSTDINVHKILVMKMIEFYQSIIEK